MKKILSITCSFAIITTLINPIVSVRGEDNSGYFIVTAYYSPLPNQKAYNTGSYESEVKLNGSGVAGASGREVFSGMLAAPSSYVFGTKIYLEGLGIGDVQDRGGAIVKAGDRGNSYDRIDLWTGYGDEGLARALAWGRQTVKGYVVHESQEPNINVAELPSADLSEKQLVEEIATHETGMVKLDLRVFTKTQIDSIEEVFNILIDVGSYDGEITNDKKDLTNAIYDYQLQKEIVTSWDSPGAGNFGPLTRDALKNDYIEHVESRVAIMEEFDREMELAYNEREARKALLAMRDELEDKVKEIQAMSLDKATREVEIYKNIEFGDSGEEVREFQNLLARWGYFEEDTTGNFGEITRSSLMNFQADNGIIEGREDINAGVLTSHTLRIIKKKITREYIFAAGKEIDVGV